VGEVIEATPVGGRSDDAPPCEVSGTRWPRYLTQDCSEGGVRLINVASDVGKGR